MENAGIAPIHGRHGVRSDQHVVRDSYSARSQEYVDLFGAMTSTHHPIVPGAQLGLHADRSVLDAGCGPGQWTGFLAQCGLTVSGIDLVPEFVELARSRYPELSFDIGRFEESAPQQDHWGV